VSTSFRGAIGAPLGAMPLGGTHLHLAGTGIVLDAKSEVIAVGAQCTYRSALCKVTRGWITVITSRMPVHSPVENDMASTVRNIGAVRWIAVTSANGIM
jgi:hypothetical protein